MVERYPVLSVSRPWSTWLACGIKPVENRVWASSYRGPLWIHASQTWDHGAIDFAERLMLDRDIFPRIEDAGSGVTYDHGSHHAADHPTGIIGLVHLDRICMQEDRRECSCGPWAMPDQHHWVMTNARPLAEPIPARGRLSVWWPDATLQALLASARFAAMDTGSDK